PSSARRGRRADSFYSITWSARSKSDGGIVRPRALAVLRLMTSSNLVGRSTGGSDGLAPLSILSTYSAYRCGRRARAVGPAHASVSVPAAPGLAHDFSWGSLS